MYISVDFYSASRYNVKKCGSLGETEMKSFVQLCENTKEKLGRQLLENEKAFLKWVYENYEDEEKKKIQGVTGQ